MPRHMHHYHQSGAGTVAINDSLDLLAEFLGVGEAVAKVTNAVSNQG